MARPSRIQFTGATYHVFSRGNRRARIFLTQKDYRVFEGMMLETMRRCGVMLFNWNQVPNHFHFNLETPDGNLSEFMQKLLTRYALYFNRTHQEIGHVFQGRYGARLVDHETYFREIVRYVELNAYRHKSGTRVELGRWPWSSLKYYLLPENQWPEGCQGAFHRVLERFGKDPAECRRNLTRFLADGLASGAWKDFYRPKDRRFIGEEEFIQECKLRNEEPIRQTPRDTMKGITLHDLTEHVQALSGLAASDLASPAKVRPASRWRQALAWVARYIYRFPVVQIAKTLHRSEAAVSLMVKRYTNPSQQPEAIALLRKLRRPLGDEEPNVKC
jgi:putative transposase